MNKVFVENDKIIIDGKERNNVGVIDDESKVKADSCILDLIKLEDQVKQFDFIKTILEEINTLKRSFEQLKNANTSKDKLFLVEARIEFHDNSIDRVSINALAPSKYSACGKVREYLLSGESGLKVKDVRGFNVCEVEVVR